jgi:hypothetical protein
MFIKNSRSENTVSANTAAEASARGGIRNRPRSFNAAAAGKFLGRFVEFQSGRSTI